MNELEEMRETLTDPRNRLKVSVHEAGHEIYARRAGAIDIEYRGPNEYPERPGEFGYAGIVPVFPESGITMDLLVMARWYAAGSVVQKVLVPDFWRENFEETDFSVFCDQAVKCSGGRATEQNIVEYWEQAKRDIERDLRSPAFRREIWALAREIEKKIPWE